MLLVSNLSSNILASFLLQVKQKKDFSRITVQTSEVSGCFVVPPRNDITSEV